MSPPERQTGPAKAPSSTAAAKLQVRGNDTPTVSQNYPDAPVFVFADTAVVTARSGRASQNHIVRCPWEAGVHHLHRAPLAFVSGRRRAPCGRGSYVVVSNVLGIVRGVA